MDSLIEQSLKQLTNQAPLMIVCVIGFVLALVFWSRCPCSAVLTLLATGLSLLTAVGLAFLQTYLSRKIGDDWTVEDYYRMTSNLNTARGVVRTVAFAFMVAAVFVGRGGRAKD